MACIRWTWTRRIQRALDRVRPYLGSHAGGVEYLGVVDGVARLRLEGSCHGCPSSTVTVQLAITSAVQDAAPEVTEVVVEGMTAPPEPKLLQIGRRPDEVRRDPHHDQSGNGGLGHPAEHRAAEFAAGQRRRRRRGRARLLGARHAVRLPRQLRGLRLLDGRGQSRPRDPRPARPAARSTTSGWRARAWPIRSAAPGPAAAAGRQPGRPGGSPRGGAPRDGPDRPAQVRPARGCGAARAGRAGCPAPAAPALAEPAPPAPVPAVAPPAAAARARPACRDPVSAEAVAAMGLLPGRAPQQSGQPAEAPERCELCATEVPRRARAHRRPGRRLAAVRVPGVLSAVHPAGRAAAGATGRCPTGTWHDPGRVMTPARVGPAGDPGRPGVLPAHLARRRRADWLLPEPGRRDRVHPGPAAVGSAWSPSTRCSARRSRMSRPH